MTEKDKTLTHDEEIRRANCSQCGGIRDCDVKGQYTERHDDENVSYIKKLRILKCRGCNYVFFQEINICSEDYDQYYDHNDEVVIEYKEYITYYPVSSKRVRPTWIAEQEVVRCGMGALYVPLVELYKALDNDLSMLAAIGVRTCFDVAAVHLGIDADLSFEKKLEALVEAGHIEEADRPSSKIVVDAGSAAAHRGWTPKAGDLATMMDVFEHFIEATFVVPAKKKQIDAAAQKMNETVPQRKRKSEQKSRPNIQTPNQE